MLTYVFNSFATKLHFTIIFFAFSIAGYLLQTYPLDPELYLPYTRWQPLKGFSLALALFHGSLLLLTMIQSIKYRLQNSQWIAKWVSMICLSTLSFWVPIYNYRIPSFLFGVTFLVLQIVMLVDFAHRFAANALRSATKESEFSVLLVALTAVFYIGSFVATGYMYYWRACNNSLILVSVNLGLIVLVGVVSILPSVRHACGHSGLFQASVVSAYMTFQVASTNCHFDRVSMLIVTMIIGILCIAYTTGSGGVVPRDLVGSEELARDNYSYQFFHFFFVCASFYMVTLLSGWYRYNDVQFWITIGTSYACCFVYFWTLFAPVVCKNRDFSIV